MQTDVTMLTYATFLLGTEILTTSVVTAVIGWYCILLKPTKWSKIYVIFFIIFDSTLITRKQFVELKFSLLVQQLLLDYLAKLKKFNSKNLIVDLAIKMFLFFFIAAKRTEFKLYRIKTFYINEITKKYGYCWLWLRFTTVKMLPKSEWRKCVFTPR